MTIKGLKVKVHQACPKLSVEKEGPIGEPDDVFSEASWLDLYYENQPFSHFYRTGKNLDVLAMDADGELGVNAGDFTKALRLIAKFGKEMGPA